MLSDENQPQIIPVNIKNIASFKNHLAFLARSDAHHDLNKEFSDAQYNKDEFLREAFDMGIPEKATKIYHETGALAASIMSVDDVPINSSGNDIHKAEKDLKTALNNKVPDCTAALYTGPPCIFKIGIVDTDMFKYKVVKFMMKCSSNTAVMTANNPCAENFGSRFVTNTNLGEDGNDVAFIVDFSQHHFMEYLVEGDKKHNFNIHYLMTPEVVNDPAGKPNVNSKTLFGPTEKGVNMISHVQADIDSISYTPYDSSDPSPANNFFSNYNFKLSPVQQMFRKGKEPKLITTLDINYDDNRQPPLSDNVQDSKGENSVASVLGYLKGVMKKIVNTKYNKDETERLAAFRKDAFNFNSKCQQKRGGDWFQVLSCIDAKNRTFNQILPPPTPGKQPQKIPKNCPVYLVTHDQIAVSYALFNGVNVIYLDFYGNVFVFKNFADPTLKGSGLPMEQLLFEGLKEKWVTNGDDTQLLTTGLHYTSERANYLKTEKENFKKKCSNVILVELRKINSNTKIGDIQKVMTEQLKKLFTEAVTLTFAQLNLVDITAAYQFVANNNYMLRGDYNVNNAASINKLSTSYNNLQSIVHRFGTMERDSHFYNIFSQWINENVFNLDVYKTANHIFDGISSDTEKTKIFDLKRIVSFFSSSTNNTNERQTDSHLFLPFIQSLDKDSRENIKSVLESAITITEIYAKLIDAEKSRPSRNGQVSPNQLYFNKLGNLIHESLFFVTHYETEVEASKAKDIPVLKIPTFESESSDDLLLQTDWDEMLNFLSGKSSNHTSEEELSLIFRGGSFMTYDPTSKKRPPTPAFCNVSVKQITWPLLDSLLNRNIKQHSTVYDRFLTYTISDDEASNKSMSMSSSPGIQLSPVAHDCIEKLVLLTKVLSNNVGRKRRLEEEDDGDGLKRMKKTNGGGLYNNLMSDHTLGFHPLVPIYCILAAYYNTISEKSEGDPFFYTYFTYINVLEKMVEVIVTEYLEKGNSVAAYLLGFGINIMLFTSNTSILQIEQIMNVINMNKHEYSTFSLKNDTFAGIFAGAARQTIDEEAVGMSLINNTLFKHFINSQVNIKGILNKGTSVNMKKNRKGDYVSDLPKHDFLKTRIFKIMGKIVQKVKTDRTPGLLEKDERKKRAELQNKNYMRKQLRASSMDQKSRSKKSRSRSNSKPKLLLIKEPTTVFERIYGTKIHTLKKRKSPSIGNNNNYVEVSTRQKLGGKKSRKKREKLPHN